MVETSDLQLQRHEGVMVILEMKNLCQYEIKDMTTNMW